MKNIIFISPHFDDICFSLGGMLPDMQVPHKTLINIFTKSGWASNPEILTSLEGMDTAQKQTTVDHMRDVEDDQFANAFQCEKMNLDFRDAILLVPPGHTNPAQYYEGMEAEASSVHDILLPVLLNYIEKEPQTSLMAPLAIGEHRNHLVTFAAMIQIATVLKPMVPLMFYEDLPYSVEPLKRRTRLAKLEPYLKSKGYQRYRRDMDDACYLRKIKEIVKYKSQMNRSLDEYAIRTQECPERHEAIWSNAGGEIVSSLF